MAHVIYKNVRRGSQLVVGIRHRDKTYGVRAICTQLRIGRLLDKVVESLGDKWDNLADGDEVLLTACPTRDRAVCQRWMGADLVYVTLLVFRDGGVVHALYHAMEVGRE